jgi:hypothetical protein
MTLNNITRAITDKLHQGSNCAVTVLSIFSRGMGVIAITW